MKYTRALHIVYLHCSILIKYQLPSGQMSCIEVDGLQYTHHSPRPLIISKIAFEVSARDESAGRIYTCTILLCEVVIRVANNVDRLDALACQLPHNGFENGYNYRLLAPQD